MTWHDCLRYKPKEETQQIEMLPSGTMQAFFMTDSKRQESTHDNIDKIKIDNGKIEQTYGAFAS